MKAPRLTWIDYAKGIAIILVLYRHVFEGLKQSGQSVQDYISLEYANIMFFSFRMPLFFIVSGIFVASSLKKRGLSSFIATKARTILYPYFLWGSLQITLQLVFSKYVNGQREIADYLYLLYLPREVEQFWYLYALFNVTVLYVLVSQKLKLSPIQNIGLGIIMYYLSAWAFQNNIIIGFVGDILHYYLFFAIGDAISRFIADRDNFRYFESWKLLGLLFIPFIATQLYFLRENIRNASEVSKYQFVEYYQPFLYILIALTGCAFVINLTFILQKLKLAGWLQELGKHSLYIYVAHVMVLASVRVLMTKFMGIHNVPVLLVTGIIMGLVVPVILYKISVKMNMRWIFSLEREKENKPVLNAS
jgi:fucose 4-O-acetylase-like acetyltransferase